MILMFGVTYVYPVGENRVPINSCHNEELSSPVDIEAGHTTDCGNQKLSFAVVSALCWRRRLIGKAFNAKMAHPVGCDEADRSSQTGAG